MTAATPRLFPRVALAVGVLLLVWSGAHPTDRFTWLLEVVPALVVAPILVLTYRRFAFTDFVYALILLHASILMLGGHYTYAEVPLGFWMEKALHLARNDYDRIGHFAQGFVPALVVREVVVRRGIIRGAGWTLFFVTSVCGAVTALYEIVEWLTAVASGDGATAFLGTQGDVWDTQEDMATCFIGALVAQLVFGKLHDAAMRRLGAQLTS
jgi:putative membrane protein